MEAMPKTLTEAIVFFANADRAQAYMVSKRWPDGVTCPICGAKDAHYLANQRRWKCKMKHDRRQFSVKTGTVMEDSPLGLDKWLTATWLIVNAKNGISSWEIHRAIGITQKSAWFLLHRIRLALKAGSFEKMGGTVEADETHVGGKTGNFKKGKKMKLRAEAKALKPGKPTHLSRVVKKAIVMGILQRGAEGEASTVRAELIESPRRPHIQDAVRKNVEAGSNLMTDALPSYKGLGADFVHESINHAISYARGNVHTNGIENFWALLSRTLQGTYVACEPFHIEAYLDEQCWRFNNRKMNDGERMLLASSMFAGKRLTYAELTGKTVGQLFQ